jgi:16S rRNA (guanine(966)-N(2))-methyltransferase RsmD
MRIIAGVAKGCVLRSLRSRALRPTAARVRESLFAVIEPQLEGARFLDLFAGAGAVGLEALSRGAAEATFVESHRAAARVIRENAGRCGFEGAARVIIAPAAHAMARLRKEGAVFEFVFADPPYGEERVGEVLARLGQWPQMLSEHGLVLCQRSRREAAGDRAGALERVRQLRFGETVVDFFRHGAETSDDCALRRDV